MNLLVCEDDPTIARLLKIVFSRESDIDMILLDSNFDEVQDNMFWPHVDVLLVDSQLGSIRGADLLSWVARKYPHVRRVMFTGDIAQTKETVTADYVVHKPGTLDELLNAVRGV